MFSIFTCPSNSNLSANSIESLFNANFQPRVVASLGHLHISLYLFLSLGLLFFVGFPAGLASLSSSLIALSSSLSRLIGLFCPVGVTSRTRFCSLGVEVIKKLSVSSKKRKKNQSG